MKRLRPLLLLILSGLFLTGCFNKEQWPVTEFAGKTMGTTFSIKVAQKLQDKQLKELDQAVNGILKSINSKMSTYDKTSELSKLNNYSGEWFSLSPETYEVISYALKVGHKSAGAYDITAGNLVNLWGFGPKGNKKIPTRAEIYDAKQSVGQRNVVLNNETHQLKKFFPKTYIDLSSIAKGYAVDRVSSYLTNRGYKNHLVEIGGEIITNGKKGDKNWVIGIESPIPNAKGINFVLSSDKNLAMATSGNYRNFFEKSDKKFSHSIDPRTGRPVTHKLASVSVLAESCMEADAWATALMVMGPEKGLEAAENEKLAAYFIFESEQGIEVRKSSAFELLLPGKKKL